ncbi:MAG: RNB domain-containing ribonuclease, partial [Elusimicrobiota bacterium]
MTKTKKTRFKGKLDKHRSGFGFVIREDGVTPDIYVSRKNLKTAMDNDFVRVELLPNSSGAKPEGRILKIIERNTLQSVGTYVVEKKFKGVKPLGSDSERIKLLKNELLKKVKNNDRVVVQIEKPPEAGKKALGRLKRIIGPCGGYEVEAEVSLVHKGIRKNFPQDTIRETKKLSGAPAAVKKKREDLRGIDCFTIDPRSAKDFDDAVSIRKKGSSYELGVHIADVGYYVREGGDIEKEAFERGTSVYLPGKVVPMLPEKISNDLCSLVPGKDRLAVSVFMNIDGHGT